MSKENTAVDIDDSNNYYKHKIQEEMFYHPVTGYRGTKSEMDTYIINRERKLNNE